MSRAEKLSIEQYRDLLLHATPPKDRWRNGINGANLPRTTHSLQRRGLLEWVASDDPDDHVVPTVAGWRALRSYEAAHARCDTGEIPDALLDEFTEYAISTDGLDITLDEARDGHHRAEVYRELARRAYAAGRASVC